MYGEQLCVSAYKIRELDVKTEEGTAFVVHSRVSARFPSSVSVLTPTVVPFLLGKALAEYTDRRHDDAVAICDLALANYVEVCP